MAGIKHPFVSGKSDGGDATLVRPSNWNAEHVVDGAILADEIASPSTPASGKSLIYPKSDGRWYTKGDDGTEHGPLGPGGVGGGGFYLDGLTLHGTHGDDCDGPSLDGIWTPRATWDSDAVQFGVGGTWLQAVLRGTSAASIFQTMPAKDTWEVIAAQSQHGGTANIVGPAVVGSTGTGVAVGFRTDEALMRIETLAAYVRDGSGNNLNVGTIAEYARGIKHWWSLRRVKTALNGDIYVVRFSEDGFTWGRELSYIPATFTPTQIGWGRFYNGASNDNMALDRFNVVDDLDQSANRLTTPTSGTVTPTSSSNFGGFGPERAIDGTASDWALSSGTTDNPPYWQAVWSVGQDLNRVLIKERGGEAFGIGHLEVTNGSGTTIVPVRSHMGGVATVWHVVDFSTITGVTTLKIVSDGGATANGGFTEVEAYLRS